MAVIVDQALRGRGLGRRLVERFLEYTRNNGRHLVGVSEVKNSGFYRACGMQVAEGAATQLMWKIGMQTDTHSGEGLIFTACPFVEVVLASKISIGMLVKNFLHPYLPELELRHHGSIMGLCANIKSLSVLLQATRILPAEEHVARRNTLEET